MENISEFSAMNYLYLFLEKIRNNWQKYIIFFFFLKQFRIFVLPCKEIVFGEKEDIYSVISRMVYVFLRFNHLCFWNKFDNSCHSVAGGCDMIYAKEVCGQSTLCKWDYHGKICIYCNYSNTYMYVRQFWWQKKINSCLVNRIQNLLMSYFQKKLKIMVRKTYPKQKLLEFLWICLPCILMHILLLPAFCQQFC